MVTANESASKENVMTIAVSLPAAIARRAEALAASEGRTMSEILSEALHDYVAGSTLHTMDDIRRYALTRNPRGYTEEDIPQLIREVRTEMAAEEAAIMTAKAS